jgi:hypothetical protein
MNIGGLAILLLVVCGGIAGLFMIMSKANLTAPVDSFGATTSVAENLTRSNATGNATSTTATGAASGVALVVGVMIVGSIIIYFVSARHGYRSRYQ